MNPEIQGDEAFGESVSRDQVIGGLRDRGEVYVVHTRKRCRLQGIAEKTKAACGLTVSTELLWEKSGKTVDHIRLENIECFNPLETVQQANTWSLQTNPRVRRGVVELKYLVEVVEENDDQPYADAEREREQATCKIRPFRLNTKRKKFEEQKTMACDH